MTLSVNKNDSNLSKVSIEDKFNTNFVKQIDVNFLKDDILYCLYPYNNLHKYKYQHRLPKHKQNVYLNNIDKSWYKSLPGPKPSPLSRKNLNQMDLFNSYAITNKKKKEKTQKNKFVHIFKFEIL